MKKNYLRQISCLGRMVLKWWLCLLLGGMLNLPATAQQKTAPRVNLKVEKTSLIRAIEALRSQTRYNFLFNSKDLQPYTDISVHLQSVTLQQALDSLLIGRKTGLEYTIEGETVVIRKKQTQEQQCTVNGRVTDNRGQALPGVTVLVKGTTMGTVTDVDGNYKISLPKIGLTLRFSFLGMGTQEIVVTGPECNVILEEEQNSLEEAVVVGYGVVKKKDLTGSVSSVDTRLIEESAAADIGTIIQGQVSGLHILTGSGAPGEEVQIQIRGCASLSGNTSPLIVVDEVPMPSDFSINQLNPSDIKSIDVLKGGSSSAIYGSRASAGVILITMKKGSRNEKPLISYDYTFGTRQLVSDINVLNTEEFKLLLLEATRNSAQEQGYTNLSDYRYYKDYTTPGYFGEVNTPWMKLLMQPARVHKHNISVRGGGHSSNYSVSYGLIDEEGMLVNTSNRRHNLNLNLDTDLNKWLKMGVTFRGDLSKRGQTENFNVAAEARPDLPCYNEDGSYYVHKYMYQGEERFESNPMIEAKERDNVNQDLGANITSYLVSRPFGGLSLRLQYSYNYKQSKGRDFYPSMTLYGSGGYKGQKGQLTNTERLSENQELMGQIMYGKRIKKHNFDITMVGTLTDSKNSYASMTFADFPDDKTQTSIWQGVTYKDQMGYDKGALLLSYVARANYSFNDRYLLTVSWRADGSSRFSPDNRWSYFPSLAVAYNLTEEKFLRHNKVINFLKLRASVGKVGMGYVDEYGWRTLYDATEYLDQPAIVPGSMGNDNLKWEGTVSYELGLDYGFFKNNRISGTLEFYKKKTKDLLYRYTLSPGIGLPSANVNFAAIENRGIDFDINAKIINTRNLSWSFSFNISKNLNKVTGLDSKYVSSPGSPALNNTVIEEGKSVGLFFGYKSDGIFQNWEEIEACEALNPEMPYQQKFRSDVLSPGDIKLLDLSNDGYVNFTANNYEDKTVLGSSLPDFSGGFSTRLTYKGFTFSMSGTFSYGNMKSWDAEGRQFQFNAARPKNLLDIALKRWTPENPTNDYPKIRLNGTNYGMTDFWLHDASYLKINNISLTYQLPAKWLRRTGFVDRAELFGSITNVYTFTSYPGPNPESFNRADKIAGAAVDYTAYPQTRTYNIGIKLSVK